MRNLITWVLAFIMIIGISSIPISFIELEFNPIKWSIISRIVFTIWTIIIFGLVISNWDDWENKANQ